MTGAIGAQQLPAWIRPRYCVPFASMEQMLTFDRPSQALFKHEEAIDMLPWYDI